MLLNVVVLVAGCGALYLGGDWLIRGMKGVGRALSLSPAVTGLLLVSFGTSAPELFVSAGAALQGYGGIAAGNAIGSNIVNIAVVLGIGAVMAMLPVQPDIARRQLPVMVGITLLSVALLLDGVITRLDGSVLLVATAGGLWWAARGSRAGRADNAMAAAAAKALDEDDGVVHDTPLASAGWSLAGLVTLVAGAEGLIWSGTHIATAFGVPEAVIALTITSIGTSLPEIAATVVAVAKREVDLAIGNVAGSNIMNLGLVLGLSGVLTPIDGSGLGALTWVWLIGLSVLLAVLGLRPGRLGRAVGVLLLCSYAAYVTLLLSA